MSSAFRLRSSLATPYHLLATARIGVRNRYAYDYACEDEYFEREMTMLEARNLPLPLPKDFAHAHPPDNEIWPAHFNDVRFNFKPQNLDRRMFLHDNYMNQYDFAHDLAHTTGFVDEDLDFELPDPYNAMHFKKKRSQVTQTIGIVIAVGMLIFLPILGLKLPQKDNPFYWRKKYATLTTLTQHQKVAMLEYGGAVPMGPETSSMITRAGWTQTGQGIRYELDNYDDLVC